MWLEDESDGPGIRRVAIISRGMAANVRLAVYLQMVAVALIAQTNVRRIEPLAADGHQR
jgi:hypothetical protein